MCRTEPTKLLTDGSQSVQQIVYRQNEWKIGTAFSVATVRTVTTFGVQKRQAIVGVLLVDGVTASHKELIHGFK
jgi:hypothetical protein